MAAPVSCNCSLNFSRQALHETRRLDRHTLPDGDVGSILNRALTLLIDDLERHRYARVVSVPIGDFDRTPESLFGDSPCDEWLPLSVGKSRIES